MSVVARLEVGTCCERAIQRAAREALDAASEGMADPQIKAEVVGNVLVVLRLHRHRPESRERRA